MSERCERSRAAISLRTDGMLSRFESALLDRHLRRCDGCRTFAAQTGALTDLLRGAPLEQPPASASAVFERLAGTRRRRRRHLAGALGAFATAATAAVLVLTPTAGERGASLSEATGSSTASPLLAVFAERPTANADMEVARLRVVPSSSADGAVRGFYGVPAAI